MALTIDWKDSFLYKKGAELYEKGIEKGIEKGAKDEKIALAKKLMAKGMTFDEVSEITGLSVKEIKAYLKSRC